MLHAYSLEVRMILNMILFSRIKLLKMNLESNWETYVTSAVCCCCGLKHQLLKSRRSMKSLYKELVHLMFTDQSHFTVSDFNL